MPKENFFEELKRRNVYRVALTYSVVAWLLIQVSSILLPTFEAPGWVMKVITLILIIGFPIALILAWAYEMSPEGMIRTDSEAAEENVLPPSRKKPFTSNMLIGFLILVIIAQLAYERFYTPSESGVSDLFGLKVKEHKIAVLPLLNLNAKDDDLEYFSDGVTQEIIHELAKIRSLVLTAFTTTSFYKNTNKSHSQIASELNVDFLMAGTSRVFAHGDSVKLHVELIDPVSQSMIWNNTFATPKDDAPSIQLKIAKYVTESLNIRLSPKESESLEMANTSSGEAFRLFLKAKAELIKLTKNGITNSLNFLEEALILDPEYAQAHTLYAWANVLGRSSWIQGNNISAYEVEQIATPHLLKAIELHPKSSDIYLVRANMNLLHKGLMKDALDDVNYALEVNSWPRIPTDYCICTVVTTYVAVGKYERAQELASIAKEIDPGNLFIYFDQATIHLANGKIEEAQAILEEAVKTVDIPFFNFFLGWSYYHGGKYEEAIPYLKRTYNFEEFALPLATAYLSNSYYKMGNLKESEVYKNEILNRLEAGHHHLHLALGTMAAARGEGEEVRRTLEKAWQDKDFGIAYFLNVDPIFKSYLQEPWVRTLRENMQYFDIDRNDIPN